MRHTKILIISSKNSYTVKRLVKEAKGTGASFKTITAKEIQNINPKDFDVLYVRSPYINGSPKYIPNVIALAKKFKKAGKKVLDANIIFGNLGKGKWQDYKKLMKAGLLIPKTQMLMRTTIPKAWPFILKWVYGFKGKNVFLIKNQKQFNEVFAKYPKGELLVQEFVASKYEYKIITVGYKALPVALRFKISDIGFRIDFKSAQSVPIYRLPQKLVKLAEKASKVLGRELAKVDILELKNKFYILEVNRFPGLDSFEELTKYNVVREFLEYLQK